MRSAEEVRVVLSLVETGANDCAISRRTGIPRGTVRDWRAGRVPRKGAALDARKLCDRCGHPRHDFDQLPRIAYAYLLGLYLGDGCISAAQRGVFRLRIELDRKYPGIIGECAEAMRAVMPANRVNRLEHRHQNSTEVSSWSRSWPCLFPQHGAGRKHDRSIQLEDWQKQIVGAAPGALLRGLIHSDGCRSVNTIRHPKKTYVYPRYLFSNRSSDIRKIFCDACDALGVEWRVMTEVQISVARRESIALLDEFVGPKS
jgi:hypothetical protein